MKKLVVVITLLMALVTFINAYSRENPGETNSQQESPSFNQTHRG